MVLTDGQVASGIPMTETKSRSDIDEDTPA